MKFLKTFFVMLLLSVAIAVVLYYVNSSETITASTTDTLGEMAVITLPVFVFLLFIYSIARAIGKKVKKRNKKSLPGQEGPNAV